jgi:hypothetical protein
MRRRQSNDTKFPSWLLTMLVKGGAKKLKKCF